MEKTLEREGMDILTALDNARVPYQYANISPTEGQVTVRRYIPRGDKGRIESRGWLKSIRELLSMQNVLVTLAEDDRPRFQRRNAEPEAKVVIALRPRKEAAR